MQRRPLLPVSIALVLLFGIGAFFLLESEPPAPPAPPPTVQPTPEPPAPEPTPRPQPTLGPGMPLVSPVNSPLPPDPPRPDQALEAKMEPFTGNVLNGQSFMPITGAEVEALLFRNGDYRPAEGYPRRAEVTRTDANGFFRFGRISVGASEVLAYRASAPGFGSMIALFPRGEGIEDRARASLLLLPEGTIGGSVVNQDAAPVEGATVGSYVIADLPDSSLDPTGQYPSAIAKSAADGTFRIAVGMDPRGGVKLPATAPGYLPATTDRLEVPTVDVRIVLTAAEASLRGRVFADAAGTPSRNATVTATLVARSVLPGVQLAQSARTDADGNYSFAALLAGSYEIKAAAPAPGVLGQGVEAGASLVIARGEEARQDLTLPEPVAVTGRFFDADTGAGVAEVLLESPIDEVTARRAAPSAKSDAEGAIAFALAVNDLPQGDSRVLPVTWPGEWLPADGAEGATAQQDGLRIEELRPGKAVTFSVPLRKGRVLRGIVLEPDGETPAREAQVALDAPGFSLALATDSAGAFSAAVPADATLDLEVGSQLGVAARRVAPQEAELRITLDALSTVTGTVRDAAGKPVSNMEMAVLREDEATAFRRVRREVEIAFTKDDGTYALRNIAPGRIGVMIRMQMSSPYANPQPQRFALAPGEEKAGVDFDLGEADYLEGIVRDAVSGEPIAGASLLTSNSLIGGQAGEDGRFRLDGIKKDAPLEFVTAQHERYLPETKRHVSIYDGELVFELRRPLAIAVRAEAAGAPLTSFRARVLRRSDGSLLDEIPVADDSGVAVFERVEPGAYRVEVRALRDGRTGSKDVTLEAESADVLVAVDAGLDLTGAVIDAGSGAPVAATVRLLNPPVGMAQPGPPGAPGTYLETAAGTDGRFRFGPLPPGAYRLRALNDAAASETVEHELRADGEPAVLELAAAPRLYGTVTSRNGQPARRGTLIAMRGRETPEGFPRRFEGTFDVRLPGSGTWTIVIAEEGTQDAWQRDLALQPGEEREIAVDFSGRVTLAGTIRVNGEPAAGDVGVQLVSAEAATAFLAAAGDGTYRAEVFPGEYQAVLSAGPLTAPLGIAVSVAASPEEQTRDLDLRLGGADVVIPAESGIAPGELRIEQQAATGPTVVFTEPRLDRASYRIQRLPEGTYRALLGPASAPTAASDWTPVTQGQMATLVLLPAGS